MAADTSLPDMEVTNQTNLDDDQHNTLNVDVDNLANKPLEFPYRYLIVPDSESPKSQFWASPIQLSIALKSSPFAEAIMDLPHVNKVKGSMVIATKSQLSCDLKSISLGAWKVSCTLLPPKALSWGVIGPIDLDENINELKDLFVSDGYPVLDVHRIQKRVSGCTIMTKCIKISFIIKSLPSKLVICGIPYRVQTYNPSARQCYNCQRFGHLSRTCKAKARCLYCGANHAFKDCQKDVKKCANCGGDHLANYGGCTIFQRAKKIEKLSWESGQPYSVIMRQLDLKAACPSYITELNLSQSQHINVPITEVTNDISSSPTYANILKGSTSSQANGHAANSFINEKQIQVATTSLTNAVNPIIDKLDKMADTVQAIINGFGELLNAVLAITNSSSSFGPIIDIIKSFTKINTSFKPQQSYSSSDLNNADKEGLNVCTTITKNSMPVILNNSQEQSQKSTKVTSKIPCLNSNASASLSSSRESRNKRKSSDTPLTASQSDLGGSKKSARKS